MKAVIVYGTNSSGTMQASELVADVGRTHGWAVDLHRANSVHHDTLTDADLVILASCSWERFVNGKKLEGQLQQHMQQFVDTCDRDHCRVHSVAIFGLGDSSYQEFCGAVDHLERFVHDHLQAEPIVPSLRVDGFFFDPDNNAAKIRQWASQVFQR